MNPEINNIPEVKKDKINKTTIFSIIVLLLIIAATICAYLFYTKATVANKDQTQMSTEKITAIVEKVNKIIDLPKGETPVLVIISDLSKLTDNPFFVKAKVGDEVLIYTLAKKAFIYDPKANFIVEASSLSLNK